MELAPVDLAACLVCMARTPGAGSRVKMAPKQKAELKIFVFVLLMVQKSGDHQLRLVAYPTVYKL